MKKIVLSLVLSGAATLLSAGTVSLTGTTNEVSFNPGFDSITLGADTCEGGQATCVLGGTQSLSGLSISWSFTMPNDGVSPFTYSYFDGSGSVSTTGTPSLLFSISDTDGDSASGTFGLSSLNADGGNGIDLNGTIDLTSLTAGTDLSAFENAIGVGSVPVDVPFVLDVDDCTHGSRSTACVTDTIVPSDLPDPSAQFVSLSLTTPGVSGTPEPGTFGLIGLALGGLIFLRRR